MRVSVRVVYMRVSVRVVCVRVRAENYLGKISDFNRLLEIGKDRFGRV
jgi:hypothetical protein